MSLMCQVTFSFIFKITHIYMMQIKATDYCVIVLNTFNVQALFVEAHLSYPKLGS